MLDISQDNLLSLRDKSCRYVRLDNSVGISRERELLLRNNPRRFVRLPISFEIGPLNPKPLQSIVVTLPLVTSIPCHPDTSLSYPFPFVNQDSSFPNALAIHLSASLSAAWFEGDLWEGMINI